MQMNRNEIRILSTLTAFAHKALWNVFICSLSLIRCLFKGPSLTLSPFVQSSPNVQVSPLIAFATLDHKQVFPWPGNASHFLSPSLFKSIIVIMITEGVSVKL